MTGAAATRRFGFDEHERATYDRDGYVVRAGVLDGGEVERLREVVEVVATRVRDRAGREGAGPEVRLRDGHRQQFSSRAAIQWEWRDGSREIRLVEPVCHLHPELGALLADRRLVEPICTALGVDEVAPFTSKLNLKRAVDGSPFPYHQDYPYWYGTVGPAAADVATAMVFLDDADAGNGALRVLPGSHRRGPLPRDLVEPTRFTTDVSSLDTSAERTVEVVAGSVVLFGAFLVHRSSPNDSDRDRRAVLLSYQPAGRPTYQDGTFDPARVEELP